MRADPAVYRDAAPGERIAQQPCRPLGGIVDGQRLAVACIVERDAAAQLEQREVLTRDVFVRYGARNEEIPLPGFRDVSVFELLSALRRVLERLPKDSVHEVTLEKITVREKMTLVLDAVRAQGRVLFEALFSEARTRMEIVVTFLAMLELVKVRAIRIVQEELGGPIVIEAAVLEQAAEAMGAPETEEEPHGT